MQVDPDVVHPKIPWGSGPSAARVAGIGFLVLAVGNAVVDLRDPTTATLARTVAAGVAGFAWGLGDWLIDRWWDKRPGMHVVTEGLAHEVERQAPSFGMWTLGAVVFYRFGGGGGGLYGITAMLVMTATSIALVTPTVAHRRYVRRNLRAGLVGS